MSMSLRTRTLLALAAALGVVLLFTAGGALADGGSAEVAGAASKSAFDEYRQRGYVWMYLGAFGFGFLTSLTPCVYPMIPIVLGVFGAREASTRRKAFLLATCYVGGMGLMYSTLGVIFAMIGKQFGTILADPWFVVPICLFYVALASSMFGAFEMNLPTSWQDKLNRVGGKGYGGAFGMGIVGGLTAAPCTGPFLAGILGFVAQSHNVPVGFTLLFAYALGMGILFWVLAVFAVSLPRSGRWMDWIKSVGGVALLAAALYFLRPIAPALTTLVSGSIWFLFGGIGLALLGVAIGAIHLSFHDAWPVRLRKALGVAIMLAGITATVNWIVTPKRFLPWVKGDEAAAFEQARIAGKGVMVDFAASWCAPCLELEHTFAEDEVYETIVAHFVPLKLDVSTQDAASDALRKRYGAVTLPSVVFLTTEGNVIGRVSEVVDEDEMMAVLEPAGGGGAGPPPPPPPPPPATPSTP
jgi:thiol:disulfide interchange protein DsbD